MFLQGNVYVSGTYRHSGLTFDDREAQLVCTLPEAIPFRSSEDPTVHTANGLELLHDVLVRHYGRAFQQPLNLLDFVCQYQPTPLLDVSTPLPYGLEVYLPSPVYLNEVAFGDSLAEIPQI